MTALLVIGVLLGVIAVLLAQVSYQAGRLAELEKVAACAAGDHPWELMTGGRAGFVRWYRCGRGCGARRMVKGAEA